MKGITRPADAGTGADRNRCDLRLAEDSGAEGRVMVRAEHLGKVYRIYPDSRARLKEAFDPAGRSFHRDYQALRDVSLCVRAGESVGLIGENGAGKSTLLKILTGITPPTCGQVHTFGPVSAILELGIGFDQEYTGVENIRVYLMLHQDEIADPEEKMREIETFADVGDFMEQPLKTWSDGMKARLAFAAAISISPQILIIDEALAVGDIFFQAKCFRRLRQIQEQGACVIMVSHDMFSIRKMCSRVLWLDHGAVRLEGDAGYVCDRYLAMKIGRDNEQARTEPETGSPDTECSEKSAGQAGEWNSGNIRQIVTQAPVLDRSRIRLIIGTGDARIESAFFAGDAGTPVRTIRTGSRCTYCMVVCFLKDVEKPLFGFELENARGDRVYGVNNFILGKEQPPARAKHRYLVCFSLRLPRIHSGEYLVTPAVASGVQSCHTVHDRLQNYDSVTVENDGFDMALIELDAEFTLRAV